MNTQHLYETLLLTYEAQEYFSRKKLYKAINAFRKASFLLNSIMEKEECRSSHTKELHEFIIHQITYLKMLDAYHKVNGSYHINFPKKISSSSYELSKIANKFLS